VKARARETERSKRDSVSIWKCARVREHTLEGVCVCACERVCVNERWAEGEGGGRKESGHSVLHQARTGAVAVC